MRVDNSQVLLQQLQSGSNFKLDDAGNMKTMGKVGAFFQKIGDTFRSAEHIAVRNERLMLKMGDLLTHGPGNAQGPQNLAAAPLENAQDRALALTNAKTALFKACTLAAAEKQFPHMPYPMQKAVATHLQLLQRSPTAPQLPASPAQMHSFTQRYLRAVVANDPNFEVNVSVLAQNYDLGTDQLEANAAALERGNSDNILDTRTRTPQKFADHIYSVALLDANRDRPAINGVRVAGENAQAMRAHFTAMITDFAPNGAEREVLTFLLSQSSLADINSQIMNQPGLPGLNPFIPEGQMPELTCFPLNGTNEEPRMTIQRNEHGDAVITCTMPMSLAGDVSDGVGLTNTGTVAPNSPLIPNQYGVVSYQVVVPHDQTFAPDVAPQLHVQNMHVHVGDLQILN